MSNPVLDRIVESYDQQSVGFDTLRPNHVRDILLVASLYDSYTLAEDGRLAEQIFGEFHNLSLSAPAYLTRVSTGEKALELLRKRRFDLVITVARVGEISVQEFGQEAKRMQPGIPVCLLTYDVRELAFLENQDATLRGIDRIFVWRGDVRLFLAVIKLIEDQQNAEHDTSVAHVPVLILVEDSIPFYSSYLPMLFDEIMKQTAALIHEGVNTTQKLLRMRGRPKILLATSYEEAWEFYTNFREVVLGLVSDVRFPRGDAVDAAAGAELIRNVRSLDPYVPVVLQSSDPNNAAVANDLDATFLYKDSPTLLKEVRQFMLENLGFGDFVFRVPDGREVARAADLLEMVQVLSTVPAESLRFHGQLNHFSNWLMARTEFSVAGALRQVKVTDFDGVEEMRDFLRQTLTTFRQRTRRGLVEDFNAMRFDASSEFVRIGGGSLGGKGRGLAFTHELLARHELENHYENLKIFVPPSAVIGTEVFDEFLESNNLLEFALSEKNDRLIMQRFQDAHLPPLAVRDLAAFLDRVRYPVAVRSSSLLEDSHYQPFAGVYCTRMLPNTDPERSARLKELTDAVKFVYASTFFQNAKEYIATTPNRMEEEKMGVVIQQIVGRRCGDYVYPHVSGTANSYNYYPVGEMRPEEGSSSVALGLGKTVVEGGRTVRFSPAHPQLLPQFSRTPDVLENAQREFWALDVTKPIDFTEEDSNLVKLDLAQAEEDGMLWPVASTYDAGDDRLRDGVSNGVKLVTFAPLLKGQVAPFADVISLLLEMGYRGMSGPVEIEFALNLEPEDGGPKEFAFLQIRPLAVVDCEIPGELEEAKPEDVFVSSPQALGNGRNCEIYDIVTVRRDTFSRDSTILIAQDVALMNSKLTKEGRPYLLLGPGRWGSADRWLGIPVSWSQISGARAILESDFADLKVEPSQGTHFFQNMTSYGIGYFNVLESEGGSVDWEWLESLPVQEETPWIRHIRLPEPLDVQIDGTRRTGRILKRQREVMVP